ncbi:signal recognition particle receptor subunit alpha [Candidatus Micrarchaeota archaeon]|nr:signal recognition particle receptor subunit alpha [Candidatus Micrarchaeota archaeon]
MDLGRGLRNVIKTLTGSTIVDESTVKSIVKELQRVLISSDVNVKIVLEMSKRIEKKALDKELMKDLTVREHVMNVVYEELVELLGETYSPILKPQKIMLLGLFGSGKTTAAAKLAHFYKNKGLKPALIACDVERPAAYDQLKQLSEKVKCAFYGISGETDVKKIINLALKTSKEDVLILDSAGRSAFDSELTIELKQIDEAFIPDQKFLVLSADIGQVAGKQAEEFDNSVGITGVIVTKMDGSAKGGGTLSAVAASNQAKVSYLGHGEKIDDLEIYNSEKFVGRLLGFPDFEALIEKIKTVSEEQGIKEKAIEKFTLEDFKEQIKAAKKMGPLDKVFGMFGAPDLPKELTQQGEHKLAKFEAIINSMTPEEKEKPELIKKNKSRLERIAKGSGTESTEVRQLIREFEKITKMVNVFKKNRGMRKKVEKMMKSGQMGNMGGGFGGLGM